MIDEKTVGGLRCGEVLALLSEYLDGSLDRASRAAIEAHLASCSECERFGGTVAQSLRALRKQRSLFADSPSVLDRLRSRLPGEER
jgi:predicted anti-sigma-YlaC factor YlaD